MNYIYTHMPQEQDIGFEERSYKVCEGVLEYNGRKVLYLDAEACDVTFCDRSYAMHLGSINVKGYIIKWQYGKNENGEALSEIETIEDEEERREISGLLRACHNISTINFV